MGKFKEIKTEVFLNNQSSEVIPNTGFTQPTFVGLIDLIKSYGFSFETELENSFERRTELFKEEEFNPNQLYLFGV